MSPGKATRCRKGKIPDASFYGGDRDVLDAVGRPGVQSVGGQHAAQPQQASS